jgi:hypothetical protein
MSDWTFWLLTLTCAQCGSRSRDGLPGAIFMRRFRPLRLAPGDRKISSSIFPNFC